MSHPLYRRLLGPRFAVLPPRVRELHDLSSASVWAGTANVERGRSPLLFPSASPLNCADFDSLAPTLLRRILDKSLAFLASLIQ